MTFTYANCLCLLYTCASARSTLDCTALEHFLQTFRLVPSVFVCVYNNLIRVLLHIGHVPRPLDGRLHRTRPLFVLANGCEPLFNRVCVFTIIIGVLARHRMSHQEQFFIESIWSHRAYLSQNKKMSLLHKEERTFIRTNLHLSAPQLGEEAVATLGIALPDPQTAV